MKIDKTRRRFPRKETLNKIFNLSVNRCQTIEDVLVDDFAYFMDDIPDIENIFLEFNDYKKKHNLMDYDDLLINLLKLLETDTKIKKEINDRFRYTMVDEYQDTNKLQHSIVLQLAGSRENVMAVGDDAQSIYSFRGADFQNIMKFPESFENCKIYKIEENYRSTAPILNLTNEIIKVAAYKYDKELFSKRTEGNLPKIVSAETEQQQSQFIVQEILSLREQNIPLDDIAVLFRSSFLAFDLEIELNKANIPYKKFGGMKFIETSHLKDMISYFKIINNPRDAISWHRVLLLLEGVGTRTAGKIIDNLIIGDSISLKNSLNLSFLQKSNQEIIKLIEFIDKLNESKLSIGEKAAMIAEFYEPQFKTKYDDWQKRNKDIEIFLGIAERYSSLTDFLSDMAIDPPIESVEDIEGESGEDEFVTLSTIHSAKGLEWRVVFLIWTLDGRFPSSKSSETREDLEEERRLFYVACTRAKEELYLTYPTNIFDRESGFVLSKPSRFLDNIQEETAERFILQDWEPGEN